MVGCRRGRGRCGRRGIRLLSVCRWGGSFGRCWAAGGGARRGGRFPGGFSCVVGGGAGRCVEPDSVGGGDVVGGGVGVDGVGGGRGGVSGRVGGSVGAGAGGDQCVWSYRGDGVCGDECAVGGGVGGGAQRVAGAGGGGGGGGGVVCGGAGGGVGVLAAGCFDGVAVCGVSVRRCRGADVSHRGF